ncbi:MAG TPA: hypothetical protein DCZ72_00205 [Armatimonadetes bacterium]|nr:hypothetical protein [Armatimonadota bacterium]
MGNRVFDKLARPEELYRSPIFVFAGDAQAAGGLRGLGSVGRGPQARARNRAQFQDLCRELSRDGAIDGCLLSPADAEALAVDERFFDGIEVTPLVRTNAETWIWSPRHGSYGTATSRPFRTVEPRDAGFCREQICAAQDFNIRLGLYSITLNNDVEADLRTLEAYLCYAKEVGRTAGFDHFLEVFLPNTPQHGLSAEEVGEYVADNIVRTMSYLRKAERPRFIKTAYTSARVWRELCEFDPTLIIGALGGPRTDARGTLELAHNVITNGGRVILFGRAVFEDENPLQMCRALRAVLDGQDPLAAYETYRAAVARAAVARADATGGAAGGD